MSKVSVVLCSYNQREYLADAIESVFRQTYDDWELVIVDNGSTDGSQELLEKWRDDPRVRLLLHEKNEAITRRLNDAIRVASGELISLLYSDDYYLPHKLERQVRIIDGLPRTVGLVYAPGKRLDVDTHEEWVDGTPKVSGFVLDDLLGTHLLVNPISPLIRRECFEQHPFYEDLFVEGELIFYRFAMTHHFHYDDDICVVMRDHQRNIGRSIRKNYGNFFACWDRLEKDSRFPKASLRTLRDMRVRTFRSAGWQSVRVLNDPKWAREMVRKMVSTRWTSIFDPKPLATLGLSFAPPRVLKLVNRAVELARPRVGHGGETDYV